jgi:chemotaxis protein methyltransferase CheR
MTTPLAQILRTFELSDQEFGLFQKFFFDQIGISLSNQKKILLLGRFNKRLNELGLDSFRAYFDIISAPENHAERQHAVDLITTNETYFFREEQHFALLRDTIAREHRQPAASSPLRVWSAACSTGEEPYSIAMTLHHALGADGWEISASDISTRVLASAQKGLFPLERVRGMPPEFLKKYCLRGQGEFEGFLLVEKYLRDRVRFLQLNLLSLPAEMRNFDVVFLRNVIIYFDAPTKLKVLRAVVNTLRPNGWLLLGHSESLFGMELPLRLIAPSVYRKL